MSYVMVGAVLSSALKPNLRLTAVVMAEVANHDGTSIFPSVEVICRRTGKKRRAVQYDLKALCKLGVLISENGRKGGKGRTSRYRLDVAALPSYEIQQSAQSTASSASSPFGSRTEDGRGTVQRDAPFSTPASREPSARRMHSGAERVQAVLERAQADAPDPLDPSVIQRTEPSLERRSHDLSENGKEQLSHVPTSLRDRQRRSSDIPSSVRLRTDGTEQAGGRAGAPAVPDGGDLERDEGGWSRSPAKDSARVRNPGEHLGWLQEGVSGAPVASVADKLIDKLRADGSPLADVFERKRAKRWRALVDLESSGGSCDPTSGPPSGYGRADDHGGQHRELQVG